MPPDLDPRHALTAQAEIQKVESRNDSGAATLAVVLPPPVTISWRSGMPGDDIITGLEISHDLTTWVVLCETNPFEDCTNYFTMPRPTEPLTVVRAFNRWNELTANQP